MNRDHFYPTIIILSRSIQHAATKEELYVISQQIKQAADDFKLFRIASMEQELADLRDQLESRLDELKRDSERGVDSHCGTYYPS